MARSGSGRGAGYYPDSGFAIGGNHGDGDDRRAKKEKQMAYFQQLSEQTQGSAPSSERDRDRPGQQQQSNPSYPFGSNANTGAGEQSHRRGRSNEEADEMSRRRQAQEEYRAQLNDDSRSHPSSNIPNSNTRSQQQYDGPGQGQGQQRGSPYARAPSPSPSSARLNIFSVAGDSEDNGKRLQRLKQQEYAEALAQDSRSKSSDPNSRTIPNRRPSPLRSELAYGDSRDGFSGYHHQQGQGQGQGQGDGYSSQRFLVPPSSSSMGQGHGQDRGFRERGTSTGGGVSSIHFG